MEHFKEFHQLEITTDEQTIIIEGPVSSSTLATYTFHEGLVAFRQANEQHLSLIKVAEQPEARIIVARCGNEVVGYAAYSYPHPLERWAEGKIEQLIELGAIEVAEPYRSFGIGKKLLQVTMMDDAVEDYIIITTEYYWHWDLKGTGLSIWDYRKVMEKMMNHGGLVYMPTDDPEICSHPANCLMVRIGERVPEQAIEQFDQLRFSRKYEMKTNDPFSNR